MNKLLCFQFQFYENIYIVIQLLHTFNFSFTHLAFMRKLPSFTEFASVADLGGGGGEGRGSPIFLNYTHQSWHLYAVVWTGKHAPREILKLKASNDSFYNIFRTNYVRFFVFETQDGEGTPAAPLSGIRLCA